MDPLMLGAALVAVATVVYVRRVRARRRLERLKVTGGRKALVMNLMSRNR